MDINVFSHTQLDTVMRVLRTALAPDTPLAPQHLSFLRTYARITNYAGNCEQLQSIAISQVVLDGAHQRKRLVQLAAVAALLNRPLSPNSATFVMELAAALDVHDSVTSMLQRLARNQHRRVRLPAVRRMFRAMIKEAYATDGLRGALSFFRAFFLKQAVNTERRWDYKRLGLLPENTLGRVFWTHMTQMGYGFPGEPGGIPHFLIYHDFGHLLAEHEQTPIGEIQQASFQGGNRREDGFVFVLLGVLQFHHGVFLTPATPPQLDNFDAELVLWAMHRGAQCNVDMTHKWDFWPLLSLTLDEARERIGLLPKLAMNEARCR